MGIELVLGVLLVLQLIGTAVFSNFALEVPAWQKVGKWLVLDALTIALYYIIGHFALIVLGLAVVIGMLVHFKWCEKNGIHPIKAKPLKKYYELRGWKWEE